ncbi:MgtC/SapB family protein [Rhizobium sp. BK661]|uniref:MgtC/SapB family protein n=1 Tax=Rhizobium sp. BK661 TaxID=2586991 RepID=UPI0038675CD3
MAANVITGIGFLGAGSIMRDGDSVKGLSTAATVWSTGAVGVFAGYGFLLLAAETTIFIIGFNFFLPKLGLRIPLAPVQSERVYLIQLECAMAQEAAVRAILLKKLNENDVWLRSLKSRDLNGTHKAEVEALVFTISRQDEVIERLAGDLSLSPEISATSWTNLDD